MKAKFLTLTILIMALLISSSLTTATEQLEIRLLIQGLDRASRAVWEGVSKMYSEINPDRVIKLESLPTGGDLYAGLTAQFLSNDPGDIMSNWPQRANTVDLTEGTIIVLDDFLDTYNPYTGRTWGEGFYPGIITANRAPTGEYMVFQMYTDRRGIFIYNQDLFNELDIETPRTWADMIRTFEALEEAGKIPIAIGNSFSDFDWLHRRTLSQLWWDWVQEADINNDGTVSLEEATRAYLGGTVSLDEPPFEEIFKLNRQIYDYAMPGWTSATADDVYRTFIMGNTGMIFGSIVTLRSLYEDELLDFDIAVFDFPIIDEETSAHGSGRVFSMGAYGTSWAVSSYVDEKGILDEVMDVVFFLQSPDAVRFICENLWVLPAGPDIDLPPPLDGFQEPDPGYQLAYGQLSNWYWGDSSLMDYVFNQYQLYLRDRLTLEELKRLIEPRFIDAYKRIAERYEWEIN